MELSVFLGVGILFIVIGVAGTVLPALPGAPLVAIGGLLIGLSDDFRIVSVFSVVVLAVLGVAALVIDSLSGILGAKKVGASSLAIVGAALGAVVGVFAGLIGVFVGPVIGAFLGEIIATSDLRKSGVVGVATGIATVVGTVLKVAIVFVMLGVLGLALAV